MKYVAFIPLRGGSKGIPGKNIRPIAGKPLAHWTVEAAHQCAKIEHIFVSTDSAEIRKSVESLALPRVEVIDRSAATATDTASTESAMMEFAQARDFSVVVLIQATSPLLRGEQLSEAVAQFESTQADSLLSVVAQKRFLWKIDENGVAVPQNYNPLRRPLRQQFSPHYVENGAFYFSKRPGFLENKCRLFGKMAAYVMPEESYHELDEPSDWQMIETMLKRRLASSSSLVERARRIKLLLTDVDGVLTDAGMYYTDHGDELKKFNTRDGKGLELLRLAGIKTGIITTENTNIVTNRARKLKTDFLFQGITDKLPILRQIQKETGLDASEIAYIGDDLNDVEVLQAVGLAATPADAVAEAKSVSHYECKQGGGQGCVREFAELVLSSRQ
jgi:N-acylneuraminate cytidylyltransferase